MTSHSVEADLAATIDRVAQAATLLDVAGLTD